MHIHKLYIWTMLIGLCLWLGGFNTSFTEGEKRQQDVKETIEALKQTIRTNPNDANAHYALGVAYYELGDYQKAIESYKQAIRIKPDYAEAHNNLGVAYGELGDYKNAMASHKEAIRLKPDFAEAHYFLGFCYYVLNDYQKAIESYKEAIRINPNYALAHSNLGAAYVKLGDWSKAIESFKQTIHINPTDVASHYNLGAAYFAVGDRSNALEQYKILKDLNKEMANKLFNLIYGNTKQAVLTANEAIKKIEAQIFYPDEQENLETADYTLIYGTQILLPQLNMKLEYGNKTKAKGKEQGSFKPESMRKKEEVKKPDIKNDTDEKTKDKARTWPNYDVTMDIWRLADPSNLLMQLFIIPLHQTFPEDKWERELTEQDDGYNLILIPKTQRPISGNDPGILIVNSVTLIIDKEFVVNKVKLTFDQSFMKSRDQAHPGMGALKFAEDSNVDVTFIKHKDKLLIKELKQVMQAGGSLKISPTYTFEFNETSGFLLPTVKHIESPSGLLGGGMEFHFLVEYLDYNVKTKVKKK